jgi:hypothetical protein
MLFPLYFSVSGRPPPRPPVAGDTCHGKSNEEEAKRVERGSFTVRSALLHVVNMPQKKTSFQVRNWREENNYYLLLVFLDSLDLLMSPQDKTGNLWHMKADGANEQTAELSEPRQALLFGEGLAEPTFTDSFPSLSVLLVCSFLPSILHLLLYTNENCI